MKKYKHLFFDLDGTLWDLKENTRNALRILFEHYHVELENIDFEDFLNRYRHHNRLAWELYRQGKLEKDVLRIIRFERAFEDCGNEQSPSFITQFAESFLDVSPRQPKAIDGAHELLDYCKSKYQLHIITNGFIEVQGFKLEAAGLTSYFSAMINSEHCGVKKPHPGIFDYAMKKAGADKEHSLMIGDEWESDIIGARDFGMDQVFLKDDESEREQSLREVFRPTHTIAKLSELIEIL